MAEPRPVRNGAWKPTAAELAAAGSLTVPDVIGPGLRVLFCGINPGLYSAAVGRHFARPGNRFWPALHAGGFTDRVYSPFEDADLPRLGYGITNLVARASAAADELSDAELVAGGLELTAKVLRYRPRVLAVVGIGAYRTAFGHPRAKLGRQEAVIGKTVIWALPNPSGLNAHYQSHDLARLFRELREAAERLDETGDSGRLPL